MKAVQATAFGDASVLSLVDIATPQPLGRDTLVRVKASGVNPIEWKIRSGVMAKAIGRDLPVTFGWACAGIVERVGADVTAFKVGQEIYSYPEFTRGGTHAEFVLIDERQAAFKPESLSFAQAAAAAMTAQAAWTAMDVAKVRSGERVLIHGGAGALGHWLIQLANHAGAEVITTASGAGVQSAADLGAARVIDYRGEQFEEAGPVDVVFDLIGGPTQIRSWALLGQGGRLISTAMPPDAEAAKTKGATGHFVFTPPSGAVLAAIGEQIDGGILKPLPVALELPLADAVRAHELGETGKAGGKMVLTTD